MFSLARFAWLNQFVSLVKTVHCVSLLALLFVFLPPALAQRSHGYVFSAFTAKGLGGGAEFVLPAGIGFGGELYAAISGGKIVPSVGIASANGYYHLGSGNRIDPYFTGGYSQFFRGSSGTGGNLGFGINLWLFRSLGLKLEFRDHVISTNGITHHWWAGHFGLNF